MDRGCGGCDVKLLKYDDQRWGEFGPKQRETTLKQSYLQLGLLGHLYRTLLRLNGRALAGKIWLISHFVNSGTWVVSGRPMLFGERCNWPKLTRVA